MKMQGMKTLVSAAFLTIAIVSSSSCGFFSSAEKKDNRAEVLGVPKEEFDSYQPLLAYLDTLSPEEREKQIEVFKALTQEEKDLIKDFFQFYSNLSPEERANIDIENVDLGNLEAVREQIELYKEFKANAFLDVTQRKAIFKQSLNCMATSPEFNTPADGGHGRIGAVELVPHNFHFPSDPNAPNKLAILNQLHNHLMRTGHMWPTHDPDDKWAKEKDVWTDWFINWGFAAHREMVVFMMFRSTVGKSLPILRELGLEYNKWKTGRIGIWGREFEPGEVQFKMVAVDPTANCKKIGESEVKSYAPQHDRPFIFSWAALPSPSSVKKMLSAAENMHKFPSTPMEYQVAIIVEGGVKNSNGNKEVIDVIDDYLNKPTTQIVDKSLRFENFDLLQIFVEYVNTKKKMHWKTLHKGFKN